jgi:signal transduction histidine kinase
MSFYKNSCLVLILFFIQINCIKAGQDNDTLKEHLKIMSPPEQMSYFALLSKSYIKIDPDKGVRFAESSLEFALKLKDKNGEGMALLLIGINKWKIFPDDVALGKIKEALSIFELTGNENGQVRALHELGYDYMDQGKYDKALELTIKADRISQKNNYEDLIAEGNNSLGQIYYHLQQPQNSFDSYFKAEKLYKKAGQIRNLAQLYNNIAVEYDEIKEYDSAKKYYEMAYENHLKNNNKVGMGISLSNLGDLYFTLKDYNRCLQANYQSLKINKEINSKLGLIINCTNLGLVYTQLNQYQKADSFYQAALKSAAEIKNYPQMVYIYSYLSDLSAKQKDFYHALEYYKHYKNFNDSVFTKSSSDKLAEIQTKYETEKINIENSRLKIQNDLKEHKIKLQLIMVSVLGFCFILVVSLLFIILNNRKKLKKLNNTKDRLFSIISHDLRSPFMVLLNLSQAIVEDIEVLTSEEIKELAKSMYISSQNVFGLLENLLKWSRIQFGGISSKPVKFDIKLKIDNAVGLLGAIAADKNIEIINQCSENSFVYADEDMISSVIQNLLSNAIKFSYKEGRIVFCSNTRKNNVEISISDTGIGISLEDVDKLLNSDGYNTSFGTMNEKGSGLGLTLCKDILELNKGKISITSLPQKGSKFSFTLPRP